ncbi:MAG: EAL domain-containing protein [Nitrosomonas sp.]|nr:EAL domain-containing protein [Nitrosomonas sp.]
MENRLRHALAAGEFILHYQPLIDARAGPRDRGGHWHAGQPPDNTIVPPGKFIPIAEETGLIVPLGEWCCAPPVSRARPDRYRIATARDSCQSVGAAVSIENLVELVQRILEKRGSRRFIWNSN